VRRRCKLPAKGDGEPRACGEPARGRAGTGWIPRPDREHGGEGDARGVARREPGPRERAARRALDRFGANRLLVALHRVSATLEQATEPDVAAWAALVGLTAGEGSASTAPSCSSPTAIS